MEENQNTFVAKKHSTTFLEAEINKREFRKITVKEIVANLIVHLTMLICKLCMCIVKIVIQAKLSVSKLHR